mmetsp:Transcript_27440/g.35969  ORF Transcript_27440/g.35969 Transcript_27440/m.35969 type:complete len:450 (-) Transcript_27440:219-1568(-)
MLIHRRSSSDISVDDDEWTENSIEKVRLDLETENHRTSRHHVLKKPSLYDEMQRFQNYFRKHLNEYDFNITTEEAYAIKGEEKPSFEGERYGSLRAPLDYQYHRHYRAKRQHLQNSIVDYFMTEINREGVRYCRGPMAQPWIIFTAGVMGVGKSHTIKYLDQQGYFPYSCFVKVDPDEIRQLLPELAGYAEHDMASAGTKTHKEAGFIVEILTLAALRDGRNVLVDGSLRDSEWHTLYFKKLKEEYPEYKIGIIHITAPEEQIFQRAAKRAETTGRVVPENLLKETLEQVPASVDILSQLPEVNYTIRISNNDNEEPAVCTPGESWLHFKTLWETTCAQDVDAEQYKGLFGFGHLVWSPPPMHSYDSILPPPPPNDTVAEEAVNDESEHQVLKELDQGSKDTKQRQPKDLSINPVPDVLSKSLISMSKEGLLVAPVDGCKGSSQPCSNL